MCAETGIVKSNNFTVSTFFKLLLLFSVCLIQWRTTFQLLAVRKSSSPTEEKTSISNKWKKRGAEEKGEETEANEDEDQDDNLTIGMIHRRLQLAKSDALKATLANDNPSTLPKLFVDNLLLDENCSEQDVVESVER